MVEKLIIWGVCLGLPLILLIYFFIWDIWYNTDKKLLASLDRLSESLNDLLKLKTGWSDEQIKDELRKRGYIE